MNAQLIRKYNVPGPRYTSYPTVPFWDEALFNKQIWIESFVKSFQESNAKEGISLYIHLPFCENLCTFCGCHKRITKRHEVEEPYISALLKEWKIYLRHFSEKPNIKEIHLGGGTPTFFSAKNLNRLMEKIFENANLADDYEFSFEGHPNHTGKEQLQTLYDLGFRRCSFGVQDYDMLVQKTINRIQPFENVKRVTDEAREIGYLSVSHDLVFGLPKQTLESVTDTINKTKQLRPDRISYYSYAHVPWIKGLGQRGFDENDLPKDEEKRMLYECGKKMFDELGYVEVGMDHFSLKTDSLYRAMVNKTLHRNFMGYTHRKTQLMIGLGMSSISDSWYAFAQNNKSVEEYQQLVNSGELPIFRGHLLSERDRIIRQHILNIMCYFETDWSTQEGDVFFDALYEKLQIFEADGIIKLSSYNLKVLPEGVPFVRNICMLFDEKLSQEKQRENLFSKVV